MVENRICGGSGSYNNNSSRDMICIDTYRVLDSCRDKDCFENVKCFLTCFGQEIIERTSNIRVKNANVVWSYIDIDNVPFNRGFYQLNIKIYVKLCLEACVCPGNMQEFEAIAVVEKKVILFGSEGNVNVFKSEPGHSGFCSKPDLSGKCLSTNLPIAVIETVDPICLSVKVVEPGCACNCCCCCDEIPENVCSCVGGNIFDDGNSKNNKLVVSLGFFSIVRIERPAQFLVNAVEYSVPDKECVVAEEDDPCKLFRNMAFPVNEFAPQPLNSSIPCEGSQERSDCKKCGG